MSVTGVVPDCGNPADLGYHHNYPPHQNPTTSHPQWYQQQQQQAPQVPYVGHHHPGGHPQVGHHPPTPQQMQYQQHQQRQPYPPRAPSRIAPETQTAQWMNQHYMNGNWAYASSPVPSIAPSVMSQSQYIDDRMSMLSVNTAMAGHGQSDAERCFSSNGSTCENVNPDNSYAQLKQEVEGILTHWFEIKDPMKRIQMSEKLYFWIRNKGLSSIDESFVTKYIQRIIMIVRDGIIPWTGPGQPIPPDYIPLVSRLLMVFRNVIQHQSAMALAVPLFLGEGYQQVFDLFCDFIPMNQDHHYARCSQSVIEFIFKAVTSRTVHCVQFIKALKFPKMVFMLRRYLHSTPCLSEYDWRISQILAIMRMMISRDPGMRKYMIDYKENEEDPFPETSLIKLIMTRVLPNVTKMPANFANISAEISVRSFSLLENLLHDENVVFSFIKMGHFSMVINILNQKIDDYRMTKDVFRLFQSISHSKAFGEVDLPFVIPFSIEIMKRHHQNLEICNMIAGSISNLVANNEKHKEETIRNNSIQLLALIMANIPSFQIIYQKTDEKEKKMNVALMSNCLRTLVNIVPFWMTTLREKMGNPQLNEIDTTLNNFCYRDWTLRFMSILSCDFGNSECNDIVEARFLVIKFLIRLIKMPNVQATVILDTVDEIRNENIVSHILNTYTWSTEIVGQYRSKEEQRNRVSLLQNSLLLIKDLMGLSPQTVANGCRFIRPNPLDFLKEAQCEKFVILVLELCYEVLEHCDEISAIWKFDRPMIEGLTNNRNAAIAKSANRLLNRIPMTHSEPLADVFANSDFF